MVLTALLLGAVLQAAPPIQTVKPNPTGLSRMTPADERRALACQSPRPAPQLLTKDGKPRPAFQHLDELPDAHMLRAVQRNYCNESDVVRMNVSDPNPAQRALEPIKGKVVKTPR